MAKTIEDIKRVIGKGKPLAVVQKFYNSWYIEESYKQTYTGSEDLYSEWKANLPDTYEPPTPDTSEAITAMEEAMRERRDTLLSECDWTQVSDVALDSDTVTAWQTYRQALRDLPEDEDWPFVEFPTKP